MSLIAIAVFSFFLSHTLSSRKQIIFRILFISIVILCSIQINPFFVSSEQLKFREKTNKEILFKKKKNIREQKKRFSTRSKRGKVRTKLKFQERQFCCSLVIRFFFIRSCIHCYTQSKTNKKKKTPKTTKVKRWLRQRVAIRQSLRKYSVGFALIHSWTERKLAETE